MNLWHLRCWQAVSSGLTIKAAAVSTQTREKERAELARGMNPTLEESQTLRGPHQTQNTPFRAPNLFLISGIRFR